MRRFFLLIVVLHLIAGMHFHAGAAGAAAGAAAPSPPPPTVTPPSLTLHALLTQIENRLIEVRRIELRSAEARAEIDHLRVSRAFHVEVEGNYREEDVDRVEVNDDRMKQGRSIDIRRGLTFSVTRPLLGRSLEQRLIAASEQQRLIELAESEVLTRREVLLEVIGLYVDLAAEQLKLPLVERAIDLETKRTRILEARHRQGESLQRDLLQANAKLALYQAEATAVARRQAGFFARLAEWVEGDPPGEFLATELDWSRMGDSPPETAANESASRSGSHSWDAGLGKVERPRIWYNLPEIDLTFFYAMGSRDRRFADETDRERGHTPGVELTLDFPLDLWRSGRSLSRQFEARAERARLAILSLERRTEGRARELALAHSEGAARVRAAEADLALREEEHRIALLLADPVDSGAVVQLEAIESEIAMITSKVALANARGELARSYFERAMIHGADPKDLALALNAGETQPVAATGWVPSSRDRSPITDIRD